MEPYKRLIIISIWQKCLINTAMCEFFVQKLINWSYNNLFRIIIRYCKLFNFAKENDHYQIEIVACGHMIEGDYLYEIVILDVI